MFWDGSSTGYGLDQHRVLVSKPPPITERNIHSGITSGYAGPSGAEAAAGWRMREDVPYCSLSTNCCWQLTLTETSAAPKVAWPYNSAPWDPNVTVRVGGPNGREATRDRHNDDSAEPSAHIYCICTCSFRNRLSEVYYCGTALTDPPKIMGEVEAKEIVNQTIHAVYRASHALRQTKGFPWVKQNLQCLAWTRHEQFENISCHLTARSILLVLQAWKQWMLIFSSVSTDSNPTYYLDMKHFRHIVGQRLTKDR